MTALRGNIVRAPNTGVGGSHPGALNDKLFCLNGERSHDGLVDKISHNNGERSHDDLGDDVFYCSAECSHDDFGDNIFRS